ncbi:hypothetical protein [Paenibacillus agaridevorans]|uniref:hypothetical protein n=1 Tax=Paenibacillus agaridevorans TaxID=171404 RepID=UPI001BE4219D|nr:hypothetical protein [Paenibacillus agaridevorans]
MDFTRGKRRQYERMMKEKPSFVRSGPSKQEKQALRKQTQEAEGKQMKHERKSNREG